jgi:hypothetical protein
VRPEPYVLGTYTRLIKAGAKNVLFSYLENVIGQDVPGRGYFGHWSWIYVLQDRAFLDQDIEAVLSGGIDAIKLPSDTPVNINGVNSTLWGWLAEQKK